MLRPPLLSRQFVPLLCCQIASAANDNFIKAAFAWLATLGVGGRAGTLLISLAGLLFALPLLLLSGLGGELADRHDKALIARRLKLAGIAIAAVAAAAMTAGSFEWLLLALFGFGAVNALFAPIVYGILPDHLRRESLPAANACVATAGFAAVILGTVGAGLAMRSAAGVPALGATTAGLAVLGWAAGRAIPRTTAAAPGLKLDYYLVRSTVRVLSGLWRAPALRRLAIVIGTLWVGLAIVLSLLPAMVTLGLHGSGRVVTIYTAVVAAAFGGGALVAAWLSAGRIALLPSVIGTLLIAVFALDLGWQAQNLPGAAAGPALAPGAFFARGGTWHLALDLALIAAGAGMALVPSLAALEAWAAPERRARTVAGANLIGAGLTAIGVIVTGTLNGAGVPEAALIYALAAINFVLARWILTTLPTHPAHELLSMLLRVVWRLDVRGLDKLAKAGPRAIVAVNHGGFLGAAIALAILPEQPVFAIDQRLAARWWVGPLLGLGRVVPLGPTRPLAIRRLIASARRGERVVIFPGGVATATGRLMKGYGGAALIAEKAAATIVPVRRERRDATAVPRPTRPRGRRPLLPKVRVRVLEPVRLAIDPALTGKARRQAAGAALHQIMTEPPGSEPGAGDCAQ